MRDAIKAKCQSCGIVYWVDNQVTDGKCCKCGGALVENMESSADYDNKRFLDNN